MQLKEFSLINPKLEASSVFQAIETVIQPEMIEAALKKTNSLESRQRKLRSSLVVCLVIAMSAARTRRIVVLRRLEGLRLRVI